MKTKMIISQYFFGIKSFLFFKVKGWKLRELNLYINHDEKKQFII